MSTSLWAIDRSKMHGVRVGPSGLPSFLDCTKHRDEHRLFGEHLGEAFDQGL
jgi:hypothetical protein